LAELEIVGDVIIPIIVGIIGLVGATIAVFWKRIESWHKGRVFQNLILRELEELTPYPTLEEIKLDPNKKKDRWSEHYQVDKKFVSKTIFAYPEQNLDFILGINPNLVYHVNQLWDEIKLQHDNKDPTKKQFEYYWDKIVEYCQNGIIRKRYKDWNEILKASNAWKELIKYYEISLAKK
jgi:hypothetical protein